MLKEFLQHVMNFFSPCVLVLKNYLLSSKNLARTLRYRLSFFRRNLEQALLLVRDLSIVSHDGVFQIQFPQESYDP